MPIKNCFHTYKVDGLGIIGISDSMPAEISQLAEYSSFVSAQADEHFWVFFNGKVQFKFECQSKIVSHFLFDYNVAVLLTELPSIQDRIINFQALIGQAPGRLFFLSFSSMFWLF